MQDENIALLQNCAFMYRLLARIYKLEIDAPLYKRLSDIKFSDHCDDETLAQGYKEFEAFFAKKHLDAITDLAVDYARVFLGAGVIDDIAAFPYESVYTNQKRLIMQEARDQVLEIYRKFGLDKDKSLDIPEDHIALEFEFMAFLCDKCEKALKDGDLKAAKELLESQKNFLNNHLLNWVFKFCDDIDKCAKSELYLAVSKITRGFVGIKTEILDYVSSNLNQKGKKA